MKSFVEFMKRTMMNKRTPTETKTTTKNQRASVNDDNHDQKPLFVTKSSRAFFMRLLGMNNYNNNNINNYQRINSKNNYLMDIEDCGRNELQLSVDKLILLKKA